MTKESARGHMKNARNQVKDILLKSRRDEVPDEESVQYALNEIKEALDQL